MVKTMSNLNQEIKPVIPNQGMLIQEEKPFFIVCKPKLLPLKSVTLEKVEKMQKEAENIAKQQLIEKSQLKS